MESPIQEGTHDDQVLQDLPKENDFSEKYEIKVNDVSQIIEIPDDTHEEPRLKRESVIQNNAVPEQEVQEVPENLTVESSVTEGAVLSTDQQTEPNDSVVTTEECAISEENFDSLAVESINESTNTRAVEENMEVDDVSRNAELNVSDSSDKNISLPLAEEEPKYEESAETIDETDVFDNLEVEHENDYSKVDSLTVEETDPLTIEGNEELNSSTEPPILEETTETVDDAVINGMPVLHKEVSENVDNSEATSNVLKPEVVVLSSSITESETIEIVQEEASGPELSDEIKEEGPKELVIPPHILGRNIDRPMSEEHIRNGKVRKPRLGVKIPNRNLTSQIVSGKEIEEEVMERSRLRNASADLPTGGDIFFAKKLTQRLAKKLTEKSSSDKTVPTASGSASDVKPFLSASNKINDNSDLIALLEGDDDVDWTPTDSSKKGSDKKNSDWERETALKQLRELPKGRGSRTSTSKMSSSSHSGKVETAKESVEPDDNAEPKFSMGVVTKTYTRKRNSSNDIKLITASILQSQKKLHADREKSSVTASPQTQTAVVTRQLEKTSQKQAESPKSPVKSPKPKHSPDKIDAVAVKNDDPELIEDEEFTPKVQKTNEAKLYSQISLEKSHPQVIITKTLSETSESILKPPLSPNTYISKSSRIVRKKKIWDPDEDNSPKYKSPISKSPKTVESNEKKPEKVAEKKIEKMPEKKVEKVQEKKLESPQPNTDKVAVLKPSNERAIPKKPKLKKVIMKKKKLKRLTEIDRLLMDEGAVNLLYAVKNTDETQSVNKKKASKTVSRDRAQRELLNKTNEIKNNLQINSTKDSPISLRKKETGMKVTPVKEIAGAISARKKSTGSAHSPPASPAFYNQHAEASRIIRRHSSSSFSSENEEGEEGSERPSSRKSSEPQKKRARTHSDRNSSIGVDKQLLSEEMAKNFNNAIEPKYTQFETFNVRIHDSFIQIILSPSGPLGTTALSVQTLTELNTVLNIIKDNKDCHAVLISSTGSAFCQGIDYKELVSTNKSECQDLAETLAKCVKTFLMNICNFPKLLIAGVHGHTVGLGVTMLPLFDMVLASDSATFSTPYTTVGCAAEGGVLFTLPYVVHNALASELFYASRKLTAGEAFRLGLVTRTLWPDKFQDELITSVKAVAGQSLQSMKAIKKQLRHLSLSKIEKALEAESSVLIQHWTSTECQSKFSEYSIESK